MNILFGIWRPSGPAVIQKELESMATHTERFAQDGKWLRVTSEIGMGMQSQYTHIRSELERGPLADEFGNIVSFDGRLDNFRTIQTLLQMDPALSDSGIVLNAYKAWGCDCFARLIGDWALALWDASRKMLVLARDHAGTRTLYYACDTRQRIVWSTYLDSFLNMTELNDLSDKYLSSYLALIPTYTQSPYRHIQAVPPGHFLRVTETRMDLCEHWTPMVSDQLRYTSDNDYDTQFTSLFRQAVDRRTGCGYPLIAELSGGMDSTSIVCMSDELTRSQGHTGRLLDTVSYIDSTDPDWDELPFVTHVEERRGKNGIHIDLSQYEASENQSYWPNVVPLQPGIDATSEHRAADLFSRLSAGGYRTIISGMGGDEMTGGVSDPLPEIADEICSGNVMRALRLSISFCVASRQSLADLSGQLVRFISSISGGPKADQAWRSVPPWLTNRARQLALASMEELPLVSFRPSVNRPSASGNCRAWWLMLRTLPHLRPNSVYRYEYRYPFLDRDLVDFLLRVPPQQLVKPGRRRSLMRRALRDIVPEKILERRRKAYSMRSDLRGVRYFSQHFETLFQSSVLADAGLLTQAPLQAALQEIVTGRNLRWLSMVLRTIRLELWVRSRIDPHMTSALVQSSVENSPRAAAADKRHAKARSYAADAQA